MSNDTQQPQPAKTIKVNGVELSYYDSGTASQTICFIHGFPFDKESWRPQLEQLQNTYRVIIPDLRGFGKSENNGKDLSIDLFASDLLALLDALEIRKTVLCGLSMGGYIAMNAAGRFPERISALVLCDTQCIADSPEGKEKRFKTIKKIEAEGLENFSNEFSKAVLCEKTVEENGSLVSQIKSTVKNNKNETVTAALRALAERRESCTLLKQVKIPTLIICGKEDALTPLSQSELLNNTIANSQLKVISDAGHLSNLEQPEEFNRHLTEFLKQLKNVQGSADVKD